MTLTLDKTLSRADVTAHLSGILQNWSQRWDVDDGGFHCSVRANGDLYRRGDYRALLIHARLLYNFSEGMLHGFDYSDIAAQTFRYLLDTLQTEQGWFQSIGRSPWQRGGGTRPGLNAYNNLFVVIAFAKYFKATQSEQAAEAALSLFDLINDRCRGDNLAENGIIAYWDPESESEQSSRYKYSGNTMLHYLEALVQLADVKIGDDVPQRLTDMRTLFLNCIYDEERAVAHDYFDGSFAQPYTDGGHTSQGHALEWIDFFRAIDGYALPEAVERNLLDSIAERAIDSETSLFVNMYYYNEAKSAGAVDFWGQPEAVKTYNLATQVYGNDYAEIGQRLLQAYFGYLVDEDQGVFYELDRNGVVTERRKGSSWKCDYHSLRMCVDLLDRQGGFLDE